MGRLQPLPQAMIFRFMKRDICVRERGVLTLGFALDQFSDVRQPKLDIYPTSDGEDQAPQSIGNCQ